MLNSIMHKISFSLTVLIMMLIIFNCGCSSKEAKFKQAEIEFNNTIEQCVANCNKIGTPEELVSLEKTRETNGIYAYRKAYGELYFKRNEVLAPVEEKLDKLQVIAQGDSKLTGKLVNLNVKWQNIKISHLFLYARNANLLVNENIPSIITRSIDVN